MLITPYVVPLIFKKSLDINGDNPLFVEIDGRRQFIQVRIGIYKAAKEILPTTEGKYLDQEIYLAVRNRCNR